ncbi:hypothetical protein MSAN_01065300 [Mycena sanguinolenta]|uniref:Uncharacterized protein n=1 Tax=Mycena sanguinolenta TaxID=230812 RepID=A0A8H6YMX0_9AGAR|nr:hypothetical protein MSAN_01065300 [Mycena sanguinolenta]
MPRPASPNKASSSSFSYEYDFPVASTSQLPPTTKTRRTRTRSPTRPKWESASYYLADDDDVSPSYPEDEYTTKRTGTGNQWLARPPSPPLYPYASAYDYPYTNYTSSAAHYAYEYTHTHPVPLLLAPPARSCDSACSILSACSSAHSTKAEKQSKKIRKARRSVDSDAPPSAFLSPTSAHPSTASTSTAPMTPPSPYFSAGTCDEDDELDSHHSHDAPQYTFSPEFDDAPIDDEEEQEGEPEVAGEQPSALRRHWAALSLRVRFGVFRAKRRMRARASCRSERLSFLSHIFSAFPHSIPPRWEMTHSHSYSRRDRETTRAHLHYLRHPLFAFAFSLVYSNLRIHTRT